MLRIKQLSVNSITLAHLVRVKIGWTCFNLFIGSNRLIVCSESSVDRSDVYLLVQDSTRLFQLSIVALFQYTFLETFTVNLELIGGDITAT